MKSLGVVVLTAIAAGFATPVFADDTDPTDIARDAGFAGCSSLVRETFKAAMILPARHFVVNSFPGTAKSAIDLSVTVGSPDDTVWEAAHFEKRGKVCYSAVHTVTALPGPCSEVLRRSKISNYTTDATGAIRPDPQTVYYQSGGTCVGIFETLDAADATN